MINIEKWLIAFIISTCIVLIVFMIVAIKEFLNYYIGKRKADIIYYVIYAIIALTVLIRFVFL